MALHIELEPIQYIGRGYACADGRAQHQPYALVFSVFLLGDGRARIFGAHGGLGRGTVAAIAAELRALGVHTVLVNRHGVECEWPVGETPRANTTPPSKALS